MRSVPRQKMMTAREVLKEVRNGRPMWLPAPLWSEFQRQCAIHCGNCSDIFADVDMARRCVVLRKQ